MHYFVGASGLEASVRVGRGFSYSQNIEPPVGYSCVLPALSFDALMPTLGRRRSRHFSLPGDSVAAASWSAALQFRRHDIEVTN